MRPEEIRSHGVQLAERVAGQVDVERRLATVVKAYRRRRLTVALAAAAAAVAVLLGLVVWLGADRPPVVTVPPTTTPDTTGLRSLPVELFVVLRGEIAVDADGVCAGTGPLEGMAEGATLTIREAIDGRPRELAIIPLPAGQVVSSDDPEAAFIQLRDHPAVCVFRLPDPGFDIADYDRLDLEPEFVPPNGYSVSYSGQRVFVVLDSSDQPDDQGAVRTYLEARRGLFFEYNDRFGDPESFPELIAAQDDDGQPLVPPLEWAHLTWDAMLRLSFEQLDAIDALDVPASIAAEHRADITATRNLFTRLAEHIDGFDTVEEFGGIFFENFHESPDLTPDLRAALIDAAEACRTLDDKIAGIIGEPTGLGCPELPPS